MKVKLCNSLFEVANIREQTDTTGQAKLSERPKRRISVKLTIWLAHLCQFVPGTKSHNWVASRVKNRTVWSEKAKTGRKVKSRTNQRKKWFSDKKSFNFGKLILRHSFPSHRQIVFFNVQIESRSPERRCILIGKMILASAFLCSVNIYFAKNILKTIQG